MSVALQFLMLTIRPATDSDCDAIWDIFREVIAAGDTYPLASNISREDALAYWFQREARVFVTEADGKIAGSYTVHANQSGGGGHVANAAFIVAGDARGQGIGRAMGEHCLNEARRLGFRARRLVQRIGGETLAGPWDENRRHSAGRIPTSDARICRRLRDVSVIGSREPHE